MRTRSAWIAVFLSALLLVSTGVHLVHSHGHDGDAASTLHPDCTLCHFHAPVAAQGTTTGHAGDPGATALLHPVTSDDSAPHRAIDRGAPRAPPTSLAN
jgi:hypothetical protein